MGRERPEKRCRVFDRIFRDLKFGVSNAKRKKRSNATNGQVVLWRVGAAEAELNNVAAGTRRVVRERSFRC